MSAIPENIVSNLKTVIAERLKVVANFNEDVNQVAEYITLLMSNGSLANDVLNDLSGLFDTIHPQELQDVVSIAFNAAELLRGGDDLNAVFAKLSNPNYSAASSAPSAPVSSESAVSISAPASAPANEPASAPVSAFQNIVDVSSSKHNPQASGRTRNVETLGHNQNLSLIHI